MCLIVMNIPVGYYVSYSHEHTSRLLMGRSQLSTFMKAYRESTLELVEGRCLGPPYVFFPENQHLFLITDSVF